MNRDPALTSSRPAAQSSTAFLIWILVGNAILAYTLSVAVWEPWELRKYLETYTVHIGLCLVGAIAAAWISWRMVKFPRVETIQVAFLISAGTNLTILALLLLTRIYYSRIFVLSFMLLSTVLLVFGLRLFFKRGELRLGLVPFGDTDLITEVGGLNVVQLPEPQLDPGISAVVADLHVSLPEEWVRFVAECSVGGVPVLHSATVYEGATGRLSLQHMSQGVLEHFQVPAVYMALKRLAEIIVILACLPLLLPISLVTALLVRLDSKGPALFRQVRVGRGGHEYTLFKFRTMTTDSEAAGSQFASTDDDRVTALGRFLRSSRIDEIPQLYNVLKGEMSIIGPRPEQVPFVRDFEEQIPFYSFRLLVPPGITGWAQVNQGYAAGADETRVKLEYDLYYIKHLSFALDLLLVFRTIKTMLTGFGAR